METSQEESRAETREDQREDQRGDDDRGNDFHDLSRIARNRQQRREGGDTGHDGEDDGEGHLLAALERGVHIGPRTPLSKSSENGNAAGIGGGA